MRAKEKHGKTVLVVEDQDEISQNMKAMLARKGYHVLNAVDAEGAISIARECAPSIILTDLDLPTLDQLMEELALQDGLSRIPVVVIDINHPENARDDVRILNSFEDLDELLLKA